jgi:hypothetical protein
MATPYSDLSSQVTSALEELQADPSLASPLQEADELFRLDDQVQIFFVTGDGRVSTFSEPVTLRIFQFRDGAKAAVEGTADGGPTVFLQVGGWTHPLVPGASPCLQAGNGAIMFPDVYADLPDCSVGLVLQDQVLPEVRAELVVLLERLTAFKKELQVEDYNLGRLGQSIVKGAELVSKGIGIGTEKASQLIVYMTENSQEQVAAADGRERADANVGPLARSSVKAAKTATSATVKISGYVANSVGKLTKPVADYLAAKVNSPVAAGIPRKNSGLMSYVVDAARGGLIAYGTIYNNLEAAAESLGTSLKTSSVKVVNQRYGAEAGEVFGDAMTAAGNGALTYMNIQTMGAKSLLKSTAKETGKSVAKNVLNLHGGEKEQVQQQPQQLA